MRARQIQNLLLDRKAGNIKSFAVLIDPDQVTETGLPLLITEAEMHHIDFFFVGGSLIVSPNFHTTVHYIKKHSSIPVVIFPGSNLHIDDQADAILLLSLISGRNPEFLIGQHVVAAPRLKASDLEIIPTGYILIDGGKPTTVSYISGTTPIPNDKPDIAVATAIAGELLGLKFIYLDAGSGAIQTVSQNIIKKLTRAVECPVIVGGGIDSAEKAMACWGAGADVIVVGNGIEANSSLIAEIKNAMYAV